MPGPIRFHVNGRLIEESNASPTTTLLEYLRRDLGLPGTKEGCAEGDCGACTIALLDRATPGGPRWRAVNSCLLLLPSLHGREIVSVEGLADGETLHPAQEALVRHSGSQCGYCTPGIVMSFFEATYRDDLDSPAKLDDQLAGNLCRCTGYRPIREALRAVAGLRPQDRFRAALESDPEPLPAVDYEVAGERFLAPATLDDLLGILDREPGARIVAGATDLGLEVTKLRRRFPLLLSIEAVPSLSRIEREGDGFRIGAGVHLTDLEAFAAREIPVLARMLRYFGARQIKHRATIGGSLANASPVGDLAPLLLALGARLRLASVRGARERSIDDFFLGYRKTALEKGELVESVFLPDPPAGARLAAYKVTKRRELDIASVSAGMFVLVGDDGLVRDARLGWGGLAATPKRATKTEGALVGKPWTEEVVRQAGAELARDFTPIDDLRGSAWYRRTVAANLLLGFFSETFEERIPSLPSRPVSTVLPGERS